MGRTNELKVLVHSARELASLVTVGQQQPYYVLECAGHRVRSKPCLSDGRNPVWSTAHKFDVTYENKAKIVVKDEITKGIIGECTVDLSRVRAFGKESQKIKLSTLGGRKQGSIILKVKYTPSQGCTYDPPPPPPPEKRENAEPAAAAAASSSPNTPLDARSEISTSSSMADLPAASSEPASRPGKAPGPLTGTAGRAEPAQADGLKRSGGPSEPPSVTPVNKGPVAAAGNGVSSAAGAKGNVFAAPFNDVDDDISLCSEDLADENFQNIDAKYSQAKEALALLTAELAVFAEDPMEEAKRGGATRAAAEAHSPAPTPTLLTPSSSVSALHTMAPLERGTHLNEPSPAVPATAAATVKAREPAAPPASTAPPATAAASAPAPATTAGVIVALKSESLKLRDERNELERQLAAAQELLATVSMQHAEEVATLNLQLQASSSAAQAAAAAARNHSDSSVGVQTEESTQRPGSASAAQEAASAAALQDAQREVAELGAELASVKAALLGTVQEKAELEEALGLMESHMQAEMAGMNAKLSAALADSAEMSRRHDDQVERLRNELADTRSNLTAMEGSSEDVAYYQGQLRRAWQQVLQLQHQVQVLETDGRERPAARSGTNTDTSEAEFLMSELVATKLELAQMKEREAVYQKQLFKATGGDISA